MPALIKPRASQRRPGGPWLRWSGRALSAAGIILLGYVALVVIQAKLYDAAANEYVNRSSPGEPFHAAPQALPDLPQAAPTEGEILGHIAIARLGVSAAVLQGTTSRTLRLGVGHVAGTPIPGAPGNSAIAGHRDTFFRQLEKIQDGDEIEVSTAGATTRYIVEWTKVVPPEDVSVLGSTRGTSLTLVTCYPFYFIGPSPKRFVVRAEQRNVVTPDIPEAGLPVRRAGPATSLQGDMP